MFPYIALIISFAFIFFVLESVGVRNGNGKHRIGAIALLSIPLAVFISMYAGDIGTDVLSYVSLYEDADESLLEPGFKLLMIIAKALGADFRAFAVFISLTELILLVFIVRRLQDPLLFMLLYVSFFFFNFHFNQIRIGLALLTVGAFYVSLRRGGLVAIFIAPMIHYASVFAVAMHRLSVMRNKRSAIVALLAFALIVTSIFVLLRNSYLHLPEGVGYRGYLEGTFVSEKKVFYPALLLKLALFWMLCRGGANVVYFWAFAIVVFMIHGIDPVLSRVSDIIFFMGSLELCMRMRFTKNRRLILLLASVVLMNNLTIPYNDCLSEIGVWCLSK